MNNEELMPVNDLSVDETGSIALEELSKAGILGGKASDYTPLAPFRINALSLGSPNGSRGHPAFGVFSRGIQFMGTNAKSPRSYIQYSSATGFLTVSMDDVEEFAFFIDCQIRIDEGEKMHWDANIGTEQHPNGTMRESGRGTLYFSIPFTAPGRKQTHFNIAQKGQPTGDLTWSLNDMAVYPVRIA